MTVTYTAEVATCRGLGCFLKLLLRWRASIYKLVWLDLAVFLFCYYTLSCIYRFALDENQKRTFEDVVKYCNEYNNLIPLSFVLGFYVNIVMTRWWSQYSTIAWPDSIAVFVSATVHGNDERGRLMRRTIVRYVCVCLTLVLTNVSPRVKKRFPTLDHFVDAGLLLENELIIFQNLNAKFPKPSKYWLPIVWAASIVTRARKEGRIRDDFAVKTLIDELNQFRAKCGRLLQYDTISIPLVYTQVVTLAVYTYFLSSVMGRQWVDEKVDNNLDNNSTKYLSKIDLYFPVFTTLQFFFYMGWLKVAETLINPFGEDDDDFDVNWIIDRNLQVSYLIVDEMHHDHPELIRDQYWDEIFPVELPYTTASQPFREDHPMPSTAGIQLSAAQQEYHPSSVKIDEMNPESIYSGKYRNDIADDAASGIHFTAGGKMSRSASRVSTRDRIGSTPSNIGGSLTRVNSVTSVLKRLFSKEDRLDGNLSTSGNKTPARLPDSSSSASLQNRYQSGPGGSTRIGVIEEVDEQLTISSMRPPENRPHVQNIFFQSGPPRPSSPVDVPENKGRNGKLLSSSAPASATTSRYRPRSAGFRSASGDGCGDDAINFNSDINISDNQGATIQDNISLRSSCSSTSNDSNDEFLRLKLERDKERKNRALRKLSRNNPLGDNNNINSNNPNNSEDIDSETLLLTELAETSRISLTPSNNQTDNV